jgi:hypothetical protein
MIEKRLRDVIMYYDLQRGAGHTRLMIDGLLQAEGNVMLFCHTYEFGERIKREVEAKNKKVKIHLTTSVNPETLRGRHEPLAVDNAALCSLLREALVCLSERNLDIAELMAKVEDLQTTSRDRFVYASEEVAGRRPGDAFMDWKDVPRPTAPKSRVQTVVASLRDDNGVVQEYHKCANHLCDRLVTMGVLYCCHNCGRAFEDKWELSGPEEPNAHPMLKHTERCDEVHIKRSQKSEALERRPYASPGAGFDRGPRDTTNQ